MTRAQLYALIVTAGILVLFAGGGGRRFTGGPGIITEQHEGALGGAQTLKADIAQVAGTLRIQTADSETAYRAVMTHDRRDRIDVSYRDGDLRIADAGRRVPRRSVTSEWDITLSRRVPVDLHVSVAAGRASVDLTGLRGEADVRGGAGEIMVAFSEGDAALEELGLRAGAGRFVATGLGYARARRIEAHAGVGEFQLDFSGPGQELTEVEITGGVGRISVTIPEGVGVRVRGRGSVTGRLTLPGFTQRGEDEHVNAAWETAPVRIDIQARLGVGGLEVRRR